jgi:hypothetical protein
MVLLVLHSYNCHRQHFLDSLLPHFLEVDIFKGVAHADSIDLTMDLNRCSSAVLVLAQFTLLSWCMGLAPDASHIPFVS